ncbi:unnamed protein product [marine sediment metagenome]|uniref:Uncharacterized protein n=1 Tax=marine sediment metagenome TaxID=412755 RepID=X1UIS0_9ZZZZ
MSNKERTQKLQKEWRENNKDRAKEVIKKWRENNKDRVKIIDRKWKENNKDRVKIIVKDKQKNTLTSTVKESLTAQNTDSVIRKIRTTDNTHL